MKVPVLLLAVVVLISVTVGTSLAYAASPPIGPLTPAQVDEALKVASAHWPANPCGGRFTIEATTREVLDPLYRGADPAYENGGAGRCDHRRCRPGDLRGADRR